MDARFTSINDGTRILYTSTHILLPEDFIEEVEGVDVLMGSIKGVTFGVDVLEESRTGDSDTPFRDSVVSYKNVSNAVAKGISMRVDYRIRFFTDSFSDWAVVPEEQGTEDIFAEDLSALINDEKSRLAGSEDRDDYETYPILCQIQFMVTSDCGDRVALKNIKIAYNSASSRVQTAIAQGEVKSPLYRLAGFFDYDGIAWGVSVFQKLQDGNLTPKFIDTHRSGFRDTFLPICLFFGFLYSFSRRLFAPAQNKDVYVAFLRSQGHFPCYSRSLSELLKIYSNRLVYMFQRGGPRPLEVGNEAADLLCATNTPPLINIYRGLDANFVAGRDTGNGDVGLAPFRDSLTTDQILNTHTYYITVDNLPFQIMWAAIWGRFSRGDEVIKDVNPVAINDFVIQPDRSQFGGVPTENTVLLSATTDGGGSVSTFLYSAADHTVESIKRDNRGRRGRSINTAIRMGNNWDGFEIFTAIRVRSGGFVTPTPRITLVTHGVGRYLGVYNRHVHIVYDNRNNDYSNMEVTEAYQRNFLPYYNTLTSQAT